MPNSVQPDFYLGSIYAWSGPISLPELLALVESHERARWHVGSEDHGLIFLHVSPEGVVSAFDTGVEN